MDKKELIGYHKKVDEKKEILRKVETERYRAIKKYLECHAVPLGTKVKVIRTGNYGFISKRELSFYGQGYDNLHVAYDINKMTKSGEMHKTANLDNCYFVDREEFEVVGDHSG